MSIRCPFISRKRYLSNIEIFHRDFALIQQNRLPIKYNLFSSSFFTNSPGNENKHEHERKAGK